MRLRIINGAASSQFWIDLGNLTGQVAATDGHAVQPVPGKLFPMAMAQRLDILVDLPAAGAFPILARLEGSIRQTRIILATKGAQVSRIADGTQAAPAVDDSLEARLAAVTPLAARVPDILHTVALGGGMKPYAWSMSGEHWPHITPLMIGKGQRVEIELVNPTMMAHPIHLHGHVFQVVEIDGRALSGAVRDTVLVSPGGRVYRLRCRQPGPMGVVSHGDRDDDRGPIPGHRRLTLPLERFPIGLNREALQLFFICRTSLRKTGVHLSGKCSN